jgi:hypothetical protein
MIRHWSMLQHVAWEGPGLIAVEAQARGLHIDIRRLHLGASIPEPDEVQGGIKAKASLSTNLDGAVLASEQVVLSEIA